MLSELRNIKVSVAILFYNPSYEDVKRTLGNIKRLSSIDCLDFNFYLIDNASPVRRLKSFLPVNLNDNVNYKQLNKNMGFGSGNNSILNDINSDFHVVMNPDIEVKDIKGFVQAIKFVESHKDVVLLSPMVRNKSNGDIQLLNRKEPTVFDLFIRFIGHNFFSNRQANFVKKKDGYDHIQTDENTTGSFMIIRTKAFKKINGFDSNFLCILRIQI